MCMLSQVHAAEASNAQADQTLGMQAALHAAIAEEGGRWSGRLDALDEQVRVRLFSLLWGTRQVLDIVFSQKS